MLFAQSLHRIAIAVAASLVACSLTGTASAAPAAPVKIMPLGDSITHGNAGYASYRYSLFFQMQAAGVNADFVGGQNSTENDAGVIARTDPISGQLVYPNYSTTFDRDNQGMSSKTSAFIRDNVISYATAQHPDVVLLMIGTNDKPGLTGGTPVDTIASNIGGIITNLRTVNPSIKVFLAYLIPGARCEPTALLSLNDKIDALASMSTQQSPVYIVDQYTQFDLNAYTQTDRVHTNVAGENFMADTWYASVAPVLVPEPTSLAAIAGVSMLLLRRSRSSAHA
jgi:lysophospholipase L1-like esterase